LILGRLLPLSLKMQFFQALVEAAASEQIARRMAMKNATDNAEEMATKYTQLYNRTRQAAITQEILEVIGGAEVLN
jgi:F-type H+-transporting ATPase subunit gamma